MCTLIYSEERKTELWLWKLFNDNAFVQKLGGETFVVRERGHPNWNRINSGAKIAILVVSISNLICILNKGFKCSSYCAPKFHRQMYIFWLYNLIIPILGYFEMYHLHHYKQIVFLSKERSEWYLILRCNIMISLYIFWASTEVQLREIPPTLSIWIEYIYFSCTTNG